MDLRRLFRMIAATAEPDDQLPAETEVIPTEGEARELDTPFAGLRSAIPVIATLTPREPGVAMSPDEVIAWDMLRQHGYSRAALAEEGVLADYLALGIRSGLEARWRGEYMEDLLKRYPAGFDGLLLSIAEYRDVPMLDRAIERLDDSVDVAGIPGETVLNDCRSALVMLDAVPFEAFVLADARQRLLETVRREAIALSGYAPNGQWREIAEDIRQRWTP